MQPDRPLLEGEYCSLTGELPVPVTPRGEVARQIVRAKIASGEYSFEEAPCLCGAQDDRLVATVDRYRIPHATVICRRCGLVRTNPRLAARAYEDFYTHHYRAIYERAGHEPEDHYRSQLGRGDARAEFILQYCQSPATAPAALELGCGGGWNLLPFHRRGWTTVGWDYDEDYLAAGRARGLDIRRGSLDHAIVEGRKYHLIILSHVLEHFLEPMADLKKLRGMLTSAGALYIEVPSLFEVTGNLLRYLQNAHTYSFVPETLRPLMASAGFRPLVLSPVIQSLWVAGETVEYPAQQNAGLVRRTEDFMWRRQIDSRIYQRCCGMIFRGRRALAHLRRPARHPLS